MGSWGMGWGWIFLVLLVIGITVLVVALVGGLGGRRHRSDPGRARRGRAREILDERYARGEIDAMEYDERRRRLDEDSEN